MTPPGDGIFDPQRALDLVAAFAGSILALFGHPKVGRWQALGIVTTGLIAAYFGTEYLVGFLPAGNGVRGVAGCLFGMFTFAGIGRAIRFVREGKLPVLGREGRDDNK
jgi:hypothetical protein